MAKPLAYCILVHDSPIQTSRLLHAIYNPDDLFLIHCDRNSPAEYCRHVEALVEGLDNVVVISRFRCRWAGFSLVRAANALLQLALDRRGDWSHALLLSGTHLPLLSRADLRARLEDDRSVLAWDELTDHIPTPEETWWRSICNRIEWRYAETEDGGMARGEPVARPDFVYAFGSQWVILARPHAEYALRPEADALRPRLEQSHVADEAYYQTILANSPYRAERERLHATHCFWTGGISPRTVGLDEYFDLIESRPALFVRKIAEVAPDEIAVRRQISQRLGAPESNLGRFWKSGEA